MASKRIARKAADATASSRPSDEIMLSIGGLVGHVELVGAPSVFVEQLRARYGAFEMPVAPSVVRDFSLRLETTSPLVRKVTSRYWETAPLRVSASGSEIAIDRWDLSVRVAETSTARRRKVLYIGEGRCEANPLSIDCVLRILWATLLPRQGALLVHGCGMRHAEVGFVFPGPSGAGKTTLARKAPDPDDVLSDELCVVRRTEDGWRVYGTPFWGDFARGGTSMRGWPLRTLAFLAQSPDDRLTMTPITSPDATLRLLGCFLSFATDAATVEQNVALAAELCGEVRSIEASLTKNAAAAEVFQRLAPHLGPDVTRKVPVASTREMISEFRAHLRKHRKYASQSKGNSMSPWLKPGDSLFVEALAESELTPGDILLYWSPGATADDDLLVSHRLVRRTADRTSGRPIYVTKGDATSRFERFENGGRYEILGKVVAVSRDGQTRRVPGRVGSFARLVGSLAAIPVLKMVGR